MYEPLFADDPVEADDDDEWDVLPRLGVGPLDEDELLLFTWVSSVLGD